MEGHGAGVNLVRLEALLKYLPVSFHFQMQKKRKLPPKSRKNPCQILCHMTSGIHWKIFATVFLCFTVGECHGSVNIGECNYF